MNAVGSRTGCLEAGAPSTSPQACRSLKRLTAQAGSSSEGPVAPLGAFRGSSSSCWACSVIGWAAGSFFMPCADEGGSSSSFGPAPLGWASTDSEARLSTPPWTFALLSHQRGPFSSMRLQLFDVVPPQSSRGQRFVAAEVRMAVMPGLSERSTWLAAGDALAADAGRGTRPPAWNPGGHHRRLGAVLGAGGRMHPSGWEPMGATGAGDEARSAFQHPMHQRHCIPSAGNPMSAHCTLQLSHIFFFGAFSFAVRIVEAGRAVRDGRGGSSSSVCAAPALDVPPSSTRLPIGSCCAPALFAGLTWSSRHACPFRRRPSSRAARRIVRKPLQASANRLRSFGSLIRNATCSHARQLSPGDSASRRNMIVGPASSPQQWLGRGPAAA